MYGDTRRLTWGEERSSCVRLLHSTLKEEIVLTAQSTSACYPLMISPLFKSVFFDYTSVGAKFSAQNKVGSHEKSLLSYCSEQEKKEKKKTRGLEHLRVTALPHCGIYEDIFP